MISSLTIATFQGSFGSSLLKEVIQTKSAKNIAVSPLAVETCLAMIRMGAEGETAQNLDQVLNNTSKDFSFIIDTYHNELKKYTSSNVLKLANKMYVINKHPINKDFEAILSSQFFTNVENIDFKKTKETAETINHWVDSKTGNAIADLEENLKPTTDLLLVSTVNFNGKWKTEFNEKWTKPDKFYIDENDNYIMLPMMKVRSYFRYGRQSAMNAGAILLPYQDSGLSMLIVVPFRADGLDKVLNTMKSLDMPSFVANSVFQRKRIEFRMPKFKVEFSGNLSESLKKMGLTKIFESGDFGQMLASSEPLAVTEIIHQTTIEVGEAGNPAPPASTADHYSRNNPFFRFSADGPFYYAILNKDFVPLIEGVFVGK
ncbi:antitrypsin-like [Musca vetustissima]|uniref:antitrypsin-like n=1 Tax=Musca vetustissima TaxID=27455 RepID=UPI002AB70A92|nr:antitrypsin-like [Musca vetustissima]